MILLGSATTAAAAPIGAFTTRGAWKYVSAPGLHPPKLNVNTRRGGLARGDFLVANLPNSGAPGKMTGEGGPLILNNKLRPVWVHGVGTKVGAANLQQESYQGKPVLVWWQGVVGPTGATKRGKVYVVDEHYRRVAKLRAKAPWVISLHDAVIAPGSSDIWVTVYRKVGNQNLRRFHGARNGTVYDVGLQEYDLKTGNLVRTWDALKGPGGKPNVPLSQSRQPAPTAKQSRAGAFWDAYHLNSIQVLPDGQLLVSMRNTWAVYLIDSLSGHTVWTLGGRHSTFNFARNARFAWQHHAEMLGNGNITLFNDDCTVTEARRLACAHGQSSGMVLHPNLVTRKVTLVKAYRHHPALHTAFLGSMQLLPNGNALVGWGSLPFLSEYSKSGRQLLDASWPGKDESYRALYTGSWVGTPFYPPSGAARIKRGKTTVFASWNGATKVSKWQVFGGRDAQHMKFLASHASGGNFETAIRLRKRFATYEVHALDSQGGTLGTSHPFQAR